MAENESGAVADLPPTLATASGVSVLSWGPNLESRSVKLTHSELYSGLEGSNSGVLGKEAIFQAIFLFSFRGLWIFVWWVKGRDGHKHTPPYPSRGNKTATKSLYPDFRRSTMGEKEVGVGPQVFTQLKKAK